MKAILDLNLIHDSRTYGDIMAVFTWRLDTDRPVLVLLPAFIRPDSDVTPCVVPLDAAFAWAPETADPAHTAHLCIQFAQALRMNECDPKLLLRIHDIVVDCLRDLIHMPPAPRRSEGEVVADAIVRDANTGKTIREGEIIDHV